MGGKLLSSVSMFTIMSVKRLNCCSYNLKEFRRHGEAGSVDLEAVAAERERINKIYAEYRPEDNLNFDESGLFGL